MGFVLLLKFHLVTEILGADLKCEKMVPFSAT